MDKNYIYVVVLSYLRKYSDEEPEREVWKAFTTEEDANKEAKSHVEEYEKSHPDMISDYEVERTEFVIK